MRTWLHYNMVPSRCKLSYSWSMIDGWPLLGARARIYKECCFYEPSTMYLALAQGTSPDARRMLVVIVVKALN